jgi:cytidine deaminase
MAQLPAEQDLVPRSSPETVTRLREAAKAVAENSYSPYSKYRVGAAIDAAGETFAGTNIENRSYPAGVCAERVALGAAISAGHFGKMTAIALYGHADNGAFAGTDAVPCGICLQWLSEIAPDIEILLCDDDGATPMRVSDLLRRPFGQRSD